MEISSRFRILHITDLHFEPMGPPVKHTGNKGSGDPEIIAALSRSFEQNFLDGLEDLVRQEEGEKWPGIVIVNGDLVNHGGIVKDDNGYTEFQAAIKFLDEIIKVLNIERKQVYIVPGNHDLTWEGEIAPSKRFDNYMEATKGFSNVQLKFDSVLPNAFRVGTLPDDTAIDLVLLASPLFGGSKDTTKTKYVEDVERRLKADHRASLSEEVRQAVIAIMKGTTGQLDLAMIGGEQRQAIHSVLGKLSPSKKSIRIAVLHHNLLPDPHLGFNPFESVIDAGAVIETLLDNKIDLVLSGHKHNRRLVRYESKGRILDLYTGPSLFLRHNTPGFTIIDLHGSDSAYYAQMNYYKTDEFEHEGSIEIRQNTQVVLDSAAACARIAALDDLSMLPQTLKAIEQALAWQHHWSSTHPKSTLLPDILELMYENLHDLGKRELTFREPQIMSLWMQLVDMIPEDASIRVVSEEDIDYWEQAMLINPEGISRELIESEDDVDNQVRPAHYSWVLRQFRGTKQRIMILDIDALKRDEVKAQKVDTIIQYMNKAEGWQVMVVNRKKLVGKRLELDFGILGDIAGHFFGDRDTYFRSIKVHFDDATIKKLNSDWDEIMDLVTWNSGPLDSLNPEKFADYLKTIRTRRT